MPTLWRPPSATWYDLDLSPLLAAHNEPNGMPPYHPAMMLNVLLHSYATGVRNSRKLAGRPASDIDFMFFAGRACPGHNAISEFRRRRLAAFHGTSSTSCWPRA